MRAHAREPATMVPHFFFYFARVSPSFVFQLTSNFAGTFSSMQIDAKLLHFLKTLKGPNNSFNFLS